MRSRAAALIDHHFMDKFLGKTERYVGVEIEMPVVNLDKKPVGPEFLKALVELLVHRFGFKPAKFTREGFPIEAVNDNRDIFSFETSYNTIEFAMGKKRSINEAADGFYEYLEALKQLAKKHHHLICGMGTNPYAQYADSRPLNTPAMMAKAEFLKKFTSHHDGEIFHTFSAATQTHLDVRLADLPDLLNLLGKLAFVDAMLFANSLPFPHEQNGEWKAKLPLSLRNEIEDHTFCFRDTLWRLCEAPNTRAYTQNYDSLEDVVNHLMNLKLFIVSDDQNGVKPIQPIQFAKYFADYHHPEKDIVYFRSLEPIAVSKHGTIEIRQTCTQPLAEIFGPTAFYTGISENYRKAMELVHEFWKANQIEMSNSELRQKAVHQEMIAPPENMHLFINNLVAVAREGLKKRGFGEEKYLRPLIDVDKVIECPAQRQIRFLEEGWEYQEIMFTYSEIEESQK